MRRRSLFCAHSREMSSVASRPAGVFKRLGRADRDAAGRHLPPALARRALIVDLDDDVVLGELAQVVAGRSARLPQTFGETAGGQRPEVAELVHDLHAKRMRKSPERLEAQRVVERMRDRGRLRGGLCGRVCGLVFGGHTDRLAVQSFLCNGYFATTSLQSLSLQLLLCTRRFGYTCAMISPCGIAYHPSGATDHSTHAADTASSAASSATPDASA